MSAIRYRPDLDGLRGVAVLMVVLFHADLGISGGYVGVDVFFVLSGYLITSIIRARQRAGTFSLADFWNRRLRRIVPAAAVVTFAVVVAGWFVQVPSRHRETLHAAAMQQAFAANVYFERHDDYFDDAATGHPLLHFWSLAVEEQFYLLYPFVLIGLNRLDDRVAGGALATIAAISLVVSEGWLSEDAGAAFYLLPSRAWELLLGGLLCWLPPVDSLRPAVREVAALLGLVVLGGIAAAYTPYTRFPGLNAIAPTASTALLIVLGGGASQPWATRCLTWRPLVFVGTVSYAFYLWHWPIFVLAKTVAADHGFEALPPWTMATLAVLSFGLAVVSTRWIERPFRRDRGARANRRTVRLLLATTPAILAAIVGYEGMHHQRTRSNPTFEHIQAAYTIREGDTELATKDVEQGELPVFGDALSQTTCLLWGDSHAMHLRSGLDDALRQTGVRGVQATHSATPPLLGFESEFQGGLGDGTPNWSQAVVRYVAAEKIDLVILAARWNAYAPVDDFSENLTQTCHALRDAGAEVAIVFDIVQTERDVIEAAQRAVYRHDPLPAIYGSEWDIAMRKRTNQLLQQAAGPEVRFVDLEPFLVDERGRWAAIQGGEILYRDRHHLTTAGSRRLTGAFVALLDRLGADDRVDGPPGTSHREGPPSQDRN